MYSFVRAYFGVRRTPNPRNADGAHGLLPSSKEGDCFILWSSPVQLADIRENQLTLANVVATVFSVHHRVKATNSACIGATEYTEIDDGLTYSIQRSN